MKHIIMICQGNICRSPMAMFLLRNELKNQNLEGEYEVTSAGLERSTEGEDMEDRAKHELDKHNIPYSVHKAHMIQPREFLAQDYVLYMENYNKVLLSRMMSGRHMEKAHRLLDYTEEKRNIDDPYFTNDFSKAYDDIERAVKGFVEQELLKK